MAEDAPAPRVRTLLAARIFYNNRFSSANCVVRNISADGARIEFSSQLALPDEFELVLLQKNQTFQARISWRNEHEVDVAFVRAQRDSGPPALEAHQDDALRLLKQENEKLRGMVLEMRTQLDAMRAREGLGPALSPESAGPDVHEPMALARPA